jgi:4-diphosphocytidyl-2-C-methyl-D-erythritol kinase
VLRVKAHAKINLSLKILGRRPDGYHVIESIMQSVELCDYITLEQIDSGIQLSTTNLRLPIDNKNLAYQAAKLFFSELKIENRKLKIGGIKAHIEKNIPLAAGLAGGSADAAAVLYGLNIMFGSPLSREDLLQMGEQIGSDVPFCLVGGNCTVRGRGEQVARNPLHAARKYIIVVPELEVSSQWAYAAWDETSFKPGAKNDLEPVVVKKYPVIQKIKDRLRELGCSFAQMSGSGPSVFGLPSREGILEEIKKEYPRSFLVQSVDCGVELLP